MPAIPKLRRKRLRRLSLSERADIAIVRVLGPRLESSVGRKVGRLGNLADEPPLLGLAAGVLLAGLLTSDARARRTGMRMLAAEALAIAFKAYGKNHVDRSRPKTLLSRNRYVMQRGTSRKASLRAFPSGHTAGAVALARAVARDYPVSRAAYLSAAALGVLQVVRRAHWPGDVLAGAGLGLIAEGVANRGLKVLTR